MKVEKLSNSVEKIFRRNGIEYLRVKDGTWICVEKPFLSAESEVLEEEYQEYIKKDSEKIKIAQDIINVKSSCVFFDKKHNLLEVRKIFGDKSINELQEKIKDHFRGVLLNLLKNY